MFKARAAASKAVLVSTAVAGATVALIASFADPAAAVTGVPAGTTPVAVSAGNTASPINAALPVSGAISGTITIAGTSTPTYAAVIAYDKTTHALHAASSDPSGAYKVKNLRTGDYYVCAYTFSTSPSAPLGLVGRCLGSSGQYRGTGVTAGATAVHVTTGNLHSGVNLALPKAGAISGVVKSAAHKKAVANVSVIAYTGGKPIGFGYTKSDGSYSIANLAPGAYKVCFSTSQATGGGVASGYLPQCFRNVAWSGATLPSRATTVTVKSAQNAKNVNALLASGGSISGVIRSASGSHPAVQNSSVAVFSGTRAVSYVSSSNAGAFRVNGLPTGTYTVCAIRGSLPKSTTTFAGRCYKNVAWTGGKPGRGTTGVATKVGSNHGGVNLSLPPRVIRYGAIAGTVTYQGQPVSQVTVSARNAAGGTVGSTVTAADGTYRINNLPAASPGYEVCFDTNNATASNIPTDGFANQCYHGVAWAGLDTTAPSNGAKVAVVAGAVHQHIDAALTDGGAIAGTITKAGGGALGFVYVYVLNAKHELARTTYASYDGSYTVKNLTPGSYTVCFDASYAYDPSDPNPNGFLNQCYNGKDWPGSI
jgi:large repetitive protein